MNPEGGGKAGGSNRESEGSQSGASQGGNPSSPGGSGGAQSGQGNGNPNGAQSPGGGQAGSSHVSDRTAGDEGSSSPLVPILIAVAVLAAISIGAVVIRQRRQRADGQISPKVG